MDRELSLKEPGDDSHLDHHGRTEGEIGALLVTAKNLSRRLKLTSASPGKGLALVGAAGLAYLTAYLLRFDFPLPADAWATFWATLPLLLAARAAAVWYWGLERKWWRFVSLADLAGIVAATVAGSAAFVVAMMFGSFGVPRTVLLIEPVMSALLMTGLMIGSRARQQGGASLRLGLGDGKRVLIVGAGHAGARAVREMRENPALRYVPVGFADDDRAKHGCVIQGVPVLGTVADVADLVREYRVEELIIAMPSARGMRMRAVVERCRATGKRFRVLPATSDIMNGRVTVGQLREPRIEDLLRRSPVALDLAPVRPLLEGAVVWVTGAGGSIGSELCRQIAQCKPKQLVMIDRYENNLYYLVAEIAGKHPDLDMWPVVADVADLTRMEPLMSTTRPRVIFQAAACKHVPLMEDNPTEAIKNNVYATRVLAQLADFYGTERFVMISTDKAINPTSVMGASKRLAELVLQGLQPRSQTRFITVRFGNVLGSEGSCAQLFSRQIAHGGPLTVTHPDVVRYFMSVDEAVRLVLHASVLGEGGEIFLLDMGEPVRILDLAMNMIQLSGLEPHVDVEIRFTGLRPGEKLYEELITASEVAAPTTHPAIFRLREQSHREWATIEHHIDELEKLALAGDTRMLREGIQRLVPEYTATANGHDLNRMAVDGPGGASPVLAKPGRRLAVVVGAR